MECEMSDFKAELTSGVLSGYRAKIKETLIHNIDPEMHAKTYVGEHIDTYAEPEFTGKYLDLLMKWYAYDNNQKALENAEKIIESIKNNQRSDGYLGGLPTGKELLNFSIWNQAFTIFGLLSCYRATKKKKSELAQKSLSVAEKCVDYVMNPFVEGNADILDATNDGTQHISILLPLCQLLEIELEKKKDTKAKFEKYREYVLFIIEKIRSSDLNFLDVQDILSLRSKKGIENFVILLGVLKYAQLFHDEKAIKSVEKYWQQVKDTQIRNTGNGTIGERWTENGNQCSFLDRSVKPNETCVAVGWIELSLALFHLQQDSKYLDAIDQTLYNHMLASVAENGSDFAYYQPNFGNKIRSTAETMYKCCRYRGFTIFSYMDSMLYYENANVLIPMLYTSNKYISTDVTIEMKTEYPYGNMIELIVVPNKDKLLKLRIPSKSSVLSLVVNEITQKCEDIDGYINVIMEKGKTLDVKLYLTYELNKEYGFIENEKYVAFSYGCNLLAAINVNRDVTLKENSCLKKEYIENRKEQLFFSVEGYVNGREANIEFCEYASADNYSVWIKVE